MLLNPYKPTICNLCNKEMLENSGCTVSTITFNGKEYKRIKAGDELLYVDADTTDDVTCPLCNVGIGKYHHWGCDVEECPICRNPLHDCDCDIECNKPWSSKNSKQAKS